MKTAFLILGAQRSGTSVTSHILSELGVDFGNAENFLQADHNPIFFELKWVNRYNDRLIQKLGYKYTDFFLPIEADYRQPSLTEVADELPDLINAEWGSKDLIGIKDPRFSLTFPVWQRALLMQGYTINVVFTFRNPSHFLRSNQQLLNNWSGWDEPRHLKFWLQLNLAALYFVRDYTVYFINYDDLVSQTLQVTQQLASFFQLNSENIVKAANVVKKSYQHHKNLGETGYSLIDHYYDLLRTQRFSELDYLHYRSHALAPTQNSLTLDLSDVSLQMQK